VVGLHQIGPEFNGNAPIAAIVCAAPRDHRHAMSYHAPTCESPQINSIPAPGRHRRHAISRAMKPMISSPAGAHRVDARVSRCTSPEVSSTVPFFSYGRGRRQHYIGLLRRLGEEHILPTTGNPSCALTRFEGVAPTTHSLAQLRTEHCPHVHARFAARA